MRTRLGLAAACVLGLAAGAHGQFPQGGFSQNPYGQQYPYPGGGFGGTQGGFMPNIYNPQTQPLSPYLNLLRGGNTGVNYYYGVRPGTVGGFGGYGGPSSLAPGGNRALFFPQIAQSQEPVDLPEATEGYSLPPAGHPVVFNNTLGYYPYPFGRGYGYGRGMGMGGFGGGGFGGVGASRPPATPRK
jgi:hypothetical protein